MFLLHNASFSFQTLKSIHILVKALIVCKEKKYTLVSLEVAIMYKIITLQTEFNNKLYSR